MVLKQIEVKPDSLDFAQDVVKGSVIIGTGFLLSQFASANSISPLQKNVLAVILGLGAFHHIVDPYLLRFVVESGKEAYYMVRRRYGTKHVRAK